MRKRRPNARRLLAGNLRRLRASRGVSQEKLAELADLHRTYVGMLERSERNATVDCLGKLAKALQCGVSDLFKDL